ncbi:hypothetical protein BABINDRAFT_167298 [Babjeviella inositovora NRRL Y-12698]|uniref:Extracellular membrane protein CFEM domain-containing protein n=1 Tax=Babjeviella inositovora NRRL Y-12698 TaxID=984486 RepID=A0A1E3QP04_9ASCO|nr:uncharacterized protein BABINDRAFT_167298 [Babjeviella inositovora NRRL Y-12698]ODQ79439.1 hypothetical protein BABINDRAFT_167298 [Babjeviella inositovora NRRL Y-12698]
MLGPHITCLRQLFAVLVLSHTVWATPPACFLACIGEIARWCPNNHADIPCICENRASVVGCLVDVCPFTHFNAARDHFLGTCIEHLGKGLPQTLPPKYPSAPPRTTPVRSRPEYPGEYDKYPECPDSDDEGWEEVIGSDGIHRFRKVEGQRSNVSKKQVFEVDPRDFGVEIDNWDTLYLPSPEQNLPVDQYVSSHRGGEANGGGGRRPEVQGLLHGPRPNKKEMEAEAAQNHQRVESSKFMGQTVEARPVEAFTGKKIFEESLPRASYSRNRVNIPRR